jgi:hypothetical protein
MQKDKYKIIKQKGYIGSFYVITINDQPFKENNGIVRFTKEFYNKNDAIKFVEFLKETGNLMED